MIRLPAPAKLNLFLHILGRRPDGYHELQTVFQLLDFGDAIEFAPSADGRIHLLNSIPGVAAEDNLIMKAARALQKASGPQMGASIHLHKHLPIGGGIGGGSSDAATTLLALNALWQCGLSLPDLAELGRQLGADIPVFVLGRSAWAEGIGERLQAIELPQKWFVVINPGCNVSTARVFGHPELTRDSAAITVAAFSEQATRNDCQALVERLFPPVADAIHWLERHPLNHTQHARMTGTGACVFACLDSETSARAILADSPWQGFVARGINESPVHGLLADATAAN